MFLKMPTMFVQKWVAAGQLPHNVCCAKQGGASTIKGSTVGLLARFFSHLTVIGKPKGLFFHDPFKNWNWDWMKCSHIRIPHPRLISSSAGKTHYDVLGLSRSATHAEIREAFLTLSKQWHPDANDDPENHKRFVEVNEAYTVLSRPLTRREYDATLNADAYVRRHMTSRPYHSHGYGYSQEAGHHYHYKGHMYNEEEFSEHFGKEEEHLKGLTRFYVLTLCCTFALVAIIMHSMYRFIPDPKHKTLRRNFMTNSEMEKHELIMTSEYRGNKVFYYAIPKEGGLKGEFDVVTVTKKKVSSDEDCDEHDIQELTSTVGRK